MTNEGSSTGAGPRDAYVAVTPGMRAMLYIASGLVFTVGISLFLLTEDTDKYFAWTIANPLTAAFLGAGYWASGLLEFLAAREKRWREARIAVPAVLTFTTLTLFVTLAYWDRFHFDSDDFITLVGTWFWLFVYASVPLVMGALFVKQGWSTGGGPDDDTPLPPFARVIYLVQGSIMLVIGLCLFADPLSAPWPWTLTDLTGRAIAAWLVALAVAAFQVAWENGLRRTRAAQVSYVVLGVLQFVALARYSDRVDFSSLEAMVYVVFLASVVILPAYLILATRRSESARRAQ